MVAAAALSALYAALAAAFGDIDKAHLKGLSDRCAALRDLAGRAFQDRTRIIARWHLGAWFFLVVALLALPTVEFLGRHDGWVLAGSAMVLVLACRSIAYLFALLAQRSHPENVLKLLSRFGWLERLMWPFELLVRGVSLVLARLVPERGARNEAQLTELAVRSTLQHAEEAGNLEADLAQLLRRVLDFKDTIAREIMVPRTQVVAFESETPLEDVLATMNEQVHSRYPVYRDRIDQIEGILFAKDLFKSLLDPNFRENFSLEDIASRPVFFAPESMKIGILLKEMQARRVHLAVVVDEFGGTSGVVSLEDILEEIVGEIRDEHDDEEEQPIVELGPGRFLANAMVSVYDLEEVIGAKLREEEGDYDSLGGMLIERLGRVPEVGESVDFGDFALIIREADPRHVARVELQRLEPTAPQSIPAAQAS